MVSFLYGSFVTQTVITSDEFHPHRRGVTISYVAGLLFEGKFGRLQTALP